MGPFLQMDSPKPMMMDGSFEICQYQNAFDFGVNPATMDIGNFVNKRKFKKIKRHIDEIIK